MRRFRFVGVALVAVLVAACGGSRSSLPASPGAVSVSSENGAVPRLLASESIDPAPAAGAPFVPTASVASGAVFKTLSAFKGRLGGPDGADPTGLEVNGTLYGTTDLGGKTGAGTVFKLTTSGVETVLYRFSTAPAQRLCSGGKPR